MYCSFSLSRKRYGYTERPCRQSMCLPEMLQDAALSRADHQLLVAAKYMQDFKFRSDQRNRVVCITACLICP